MDVQPYIGREYVGDYYCRVFARDVLADHEIPLPDVDTPAKADEWQSVERPRALDVVVFNRGGMPAHIGVCVDSARFLHVDVGHRGRVERLDGIMWRNRIEGFYRYTPCSN